MIHLRFEFVKRERDGKYHYELVGMRPFPADILPAMLILICQEINKLDLPAENAIKLAAQDVLKALEL